MLEYMLSATLRLTCIFVVFSDPLPQRMQDEARDAVDRHLRSSSLHSELTEVDIAEAVAMAVIEVDWKVHSTVSQSDM